MAAQAGIGLVQSSYKAAYHIASLQGQFNDLQKLRIIGKVCAPTKKSEISVKKL